MFRPNIYDFLSQNKHDECFRNVFRFLWSERIPNNNIEVSIVFASVRNFYIHWNGQSNNYQRGDCAHICACAGFARASAQIFSCAIAQSAARLISWCFLYFARSIARASARKCFAIVPLSIISSIKQPVAARPDGGGSQPKTSEFSVSRDLWTVPDFHVVLWNQTEVFSKHVIYVRKAVRSPTNHSRFIYSFLPCIRGRP